MIANPAVRCAVFEKEAAAQVIHLHPTLTLAGRSISLGQPELERSSRRLAADTSSLHFSNLAARH